MVVHLQWLRELPTGPLKPVFSPDKSKKVYWKKITIAIAIIK